MISGVGRETDGPDKTPPTADQRHLTFGRQLAAARAAARVTQEDLAARLGVKQSTVSGWENGVNSPEEIETTFQIERLLGVNPGELSRHLGYLPVEAVQIAGSFEDAITGDPLLDDADRSALRNVYEMAVRTRRNRRGRPKN